ncbi:MAG: hypothetical protein ACRDRQ_08615 [Pseudonocardiaceae bacterium]
MPVRGTTSPWAQDVDLIVVVEVGATAAFLGTDRNRAPAYVLVAPPTPPRPSNLKTAMSPTPPPNRLRSDRLRTSTVLWKKVATSPSLI